MTIFARTIFYNFYKFEGRRNTQKSPDLRKISILTHFFKSNFGLWQVYVNTLELLILSGSEDLSRDISNLLGQIFLHWFGKEWKRVAWKTSTFQDLAWARKWILLETVMGDKITLATVMRQASQSERCNYQEKVGHIFEGHIICMTQYLHVMMPPSHLCIDGTMFP